MKTIGKILRTPTGKKWRGLLMLMIGLLGFTLALSRSQKEADAIGDTNLVLAFYYAWFDPTSFGPGKTPFNPIHPYFSTDTSTIRRHVNTARAAGIDGLVQSWYGPNPNQQTEPNFAKLLDIASESGFKAAVDFEVASPFFGGNQDRIDALKALLNTHARHGAYLRMDGKPVIFFWANWILPVEDWRYIRQQADPYNTAIWIAEGGHTEYLSVFDGLHLYNVAWSANPAGINARWAGETRAAADAYGGYKYWVGTAMPGFNNTNVRGVEHTVRNRGNGSYLRDSFLGAAATNPDLLILTSFNEWPEGSGIEPSLEYGNSYINQMRQLSADYKGVGAGSFPPIPVWVAPQPTATPTTIPTVAPTRTPVPTNTPWPTNTPRPGATTTPVPTATFAPLVNQSSGLAEDGPTATPIIIAQAPQTASDGLYAVEAGDTLFGISLRFGISLDELLEWNNLQRDSLISIGQLLVVQQPPAAAQSETVEDEASVAPTNTPEAVAQVEPTATTEPTATSDPNTLPAADENGNILYTVVSGDSFIGISNRFGLTVDELYRLNNLSEESTLRIGQQLILGVEELSAETNPNSPLEPAIPDQFAGAELRDDGALLHNVVAGDTLISIAVTYGYDTMDAFYEVSGLSNASILSVDQQVIVGFKPQPAAQGGSTDAATATNTPTPTNTPIPSATPSPTLPPIPTRTLPPPPTPTPEGVAVVVTEPPTPIVVDQTADEPISAESATVQTAQTDSNTPILIGLLGVALILMAAIGYMLFGRK